MEQSWNAYRRSRIKLFITDNLKPLHLIVTALLL